MAAGTSGPDWQVHPSLQFRTAAVRGCRNGTMLLQEQIDPVADDLNVEYEYSTSGLCSTWSVCAKDLLLVAAVESAPEFLGNMPPSSNKRWGGVTGGL
jgi:hypothetical protein